MSRRFAFPLQKALDWYRQSLAAEEALLQRIVNDIRGLDRLKESLERCRHSEQAELQRTDHILGKDLRGLANYSALIRADLQHLAAERSRKQASLVEQRRRVSVHHRRVQVLEELEQRRKAEWVRGASLEEDSLATDMFLGAMSRKATRNRALGESEQSQ
jgi:hypothetical protein